MKRISLFLILLVTILTSCSLLSFSFKNLSSPSREIRVKIDVKDGEDSYTFKQETEDEGEVEYKLTYNVDGVSGTVKITEYTNELGEVVYEYKISEGNRERDVERGRPDYDFDDDDEEEEDEEEEENNEA